MLDMRFNVWLWKWLCGACVGLYCIATCDYFSI